MKGRSLSALWPASGGVVFVEYLIAFLPILFFGLATWQMIELWTGDLILRRAASAAARAAAVVLPDDPKFYGETPVNSFSGARKTDIELAAAMVLAVSPHFQTKPTVEVSGASGHQLLTATVSAPFHCFAGWVSLVCGGSSRLLTARASFPYQGANYGYKD